MRIAHRIFHVCWVPCCAVALLVQTRTMHHEPPLSGWVDGFVFGGTLFGYHFNHTYGYYRAAAILAGLFAGICFLMAWKSAPHPTGWFFAGTMPFLFWLGYYGFTRNGKLGFRNLPRAKPLVVALTWAWVTVLLPLPAEPNASWFFLWLGRALFILALALGYDLVDTAYDQRHGLVTWTGRLGEKGALSLINRSLFLSGLCAVVHVGDGIPGISELFAQLISLVIGAWWLPFLLRKKTWEPWHKVLIDALMVLQVALVVLSQGGLILQP